MTTATAPRTVTLAPATISEWRYRLRTIMVPLGKIDRRLIDPIEDMCGRMSAVGAVQSDTVVIDRTEPLLWQAQFMVTAGKAAARAGASHESVLVLRGVVDEIGTAVGMAVTK